MFIYPASGDGAGGYGATPAVDQTSAMRKAYIDTGHGQVHVREAGAGDRTLLLVHWTPLSGRMFEGVAPRFADAGFRVIAPDLLGYGRSDARPLDWSIAAWADNLAETLAVLRAERVDALGGHNGASIVLELSLRHPALVGRLVLDGCPLLTPELRAAFSALSAWRPPTDPQEVFDRTVGLLAEYIPGFTPQGGNLALLWPAMIDYLETRFVPSAPIAGAYDIADRLPLATHPALLLGAEKDSLGANFGPAAALLEPRAQHLFPGHHPLHFAERWDEYADIVTAFLKP